MILEAAKAGFINKQKYSINLDYSLKTDLKTGMDKKLLSAWSAYNKALSKISQIMQETKNIVGEFAENLASMY